MVLTFTGKPRGQYSTIHVLGPDGERRDSGHGSVGNDTVSELLGGSRPAGAYRVDWRVLSDDGHVVSGTFTFTAGASAAALAARRPDPSAQAVKKPGRSSTGVAVGVVAALLVLIGGRVGYLGTRRSRRTGRFARTDIDQQDS